MKTPFSIFNFQFIQTARRAFTLIELLVVMGIFGIISTMILANHSRFNSSVLLGSLAYDIALSVRQAQVYGLSVQTFNSGFQVGYGIHFSSVTSYFLFADTNATKKYEEGVDSIIQTYSVGQGHSVKRFCAFNTLAQSTCSDDGDTPITYLDVVFLRPDPDANISSNNPGYTSSAKVTVTSPSGETRSITIASTGQISVSNP